MPQNNWDVSSGRTCCQCVLPDFCQGGLHMLDSGIQPGRKKADKIYNWLRASIDENKFSSNQRLPSENELCRRLDVSRETVRAAMARLVEENLVTRVKGSGTYINKDAAVSGPARSLNAEYKIGLILQGQDSHANSRLIDGIRDVMSDTDVDLQIFFTDNKFSNERNCLDVVAHQGFDGFIVDGVKASLLNPNLDCYRNIFAKKIPVIFYNNYYKELNYPRVINNDYKCARELIGLLTRAGHKKIAGIFVYDNYQSIEKFRGYVGSLRSAGLIFEDDYIKWCISNEAHADGFYKEIGKFLKGLPKCTAIVCCNYMILQSVLHFLQENGKSVPNDYSLVCFDYSGQDWERSGITCSIHPGYDMGIQVGKRLLKMIQNHEYCGNGYSYLMDLRIYEGRSIRKL